MTTFFNNTACVMGGPVTNGNNTPRRDSYPNVCHSVTSMLINSLCVLFHSVREVKFRKEMMLLHERIE